MSVDVVEGASESLDRPVLDTVMNVTDVVDHKEDVCVGDVQVKGYLWR